MEFEIGSKVVLKSDGPSMTVVEVVQGSESKFAVCNWFDHYTVVSGTFPFGALREIA